MSKYRLVEAACDERWDRFVESSPNGTAFASVAYLEALGVPVHAYYCLKSDEPMAAFFAPVEAGGERLVGHDFVIYDGLMYRDLPRLNHAQRGSEQFKIQEGVAQELAERYRGVRTALHSSLVDVRPFLWFNYGTDQPKYSAEIRYTSHVEIADFATAERLEDIAIYNRASVSRRQEIRYGMRKGVVTEQSDDAAGFAEYYRMTMARQGIVVATAVCERMEALVAGLTACGRALMVESKDADGRIGSMAVYLLDRRRAYYLFGASDPEMRNTHTGTAVLWEAFHRLARQGVDEVDLEGVNSPQRGWFKLSFGGDLRPYYELSFER
ncbi:GNAT family N-acetyltransferase [Endothiovibrio diazotrophicus]